MLKESLGMEERFLLIFSCHQDMNEREKLGMGVDHDPHFSFLHSRWAKNEPCPNSCLNLSLGTFTAWWHYATVYPMYLVILSRQPNLYSTHRLTETCRNRGHQVRVIDPMSCPIEFNGRSALPPSPLPDAILPRIGASITEFGCAVVRQYELQGVWAVNPAIGITRSRDKLLSMQLLHGRKVPIPRTAVTGQLHTLEHAIKAVGGPPVVMKLRRGTQGKGVVLVRTMAAARRAHAVLNTFQQYTLVQEYISEARNRDFRVIVVGRRAVAAMERQAPPGDFRANLHRGGQAKSISLTEELESLAIQATQVHELNFAGVDLMMTSHGPAVIEVNSSPGLQGIESATGIDIATELIEFVECEIAHRRRDDA